MRGMARCNICGETSEPIERASVRSNVRKFRNETFTVWRCPSCLSVHSEQDVDLGHYYADYPFHAIGESRDVDWMLKAMYRRQLARLRAAGLSRDTALLDYGCGGGAFLRFLRASGYSNVHGFDEYSDSYGDERVLDARYDVILSQDVIEHVAEPWDFLRTLQRSLAPGGRVALGTPNAEAIDLRDPEQSVHALHQPYHRHILSKRALLGLGAELKWQLVRYFPTMYSNTALPFVNQRFLLHYFKTCDDTLDLANEPIHTENRALYTPATLYWGLFGYFHAPETDVMVIYRAAQ
jgi:SAM-dependent methyltransferase